MLASKDDMDEIQDCLPRTLPASGLMIKANLFHLMAQRIAVNAEGLCGFGLIAIIPFQYLFDKALLKFTHRILVADSMLDHLVDKSVQLVFHGKLQRCKSYGAAGLVLAPALASVDDSLSELLKSCTKIVAQGLRHHKGYGPRPGRNIWRQLGSAHGLTLNGEGH
jgi:hypothetical protein